MLDTQAMSPKQMRSVVEADSWINIWTGSIRSGKTISSLLRWLMFVADAPRGGNLLVVGRTRESIARNIFQPLQDPSLFGTFAGHVSYTPGAPSGMILGRRIDVLGASDSRSEAVLRGLTVAGAYVDEGTLVSEAFWKQLTGRTSVPGAKIFVTTNPDAPAHWFKKSLIDVAELHEHRVFQFYLEDNAWLMRTNPDWVARIKREYTGLWYRRFIKGEWVQAEGAIYDMWDPARHVIAADKIPAIERVIGMGVDYGTTNATRGLLVGIGRHPDHGPKLYVLDEWAPPSSTDAHLSASLRSWLGSLEPESWRRPSWVFVDPAAASFKKQLFEDGLTNVANGFNAVLPGIRTIASLLATDNLLVSDRCKHLIDQLPGYAWDPKATDKGEDAPIKQDDHEVDALRYAIHSSRTLWRTQIPVTAAADSAPGTDPDQPEGSTNATPQR